MLNHVVEDSWTEENPNAYFPRRRAYLADDHELSIPQTRYLQNAAYIRLKNLTFGYTIPKEVSRKIKIEKLRQKCTRLYVVVQAGSGLKVNRYFFIMEGTEKN